VKNNQNSNFSITNNTSGATLTDVVPFLDIKDNILGRDYILSLVFINDETSQELNSKYRKKDKPTNVLSFPIENTEGEIFINIDAVKREHDDFERDEEKFIGYLFIHGLFHLKGLEHGSKMESEEEKARIKFDI